MQVPIKEITDPDVPLHLKQMHDNLRLRVEKTGQLTNEDNAELRLIEREILRSKNQKYEIRNPTDIQLGTKSRSSGKIGNIDPDDFKGPANEREEIAELDRPESFLNEGEADITNLSNTNRVDEDLGLGDVAKRKVWEESVSSTIRGMIDEHSKNEIVQKRRKFSKNEADPFRHQVDVEEDFLLNKAGSRNSGREYEMSDDGQLYFGDNETNAYLIDSEGNRINKPGGDSWRYAVHNQTPLKFIVYGKKSGKPKIIEGLANKDNRVHIDYEGRFDDFRNVKGAGMQIYGAAARTLGDTLNFITPGDAFDPISEHGRSMIDRGEKAYSSGMRNQMNMYPGFGRANAVNVGSQALGSIVVPFLSAKALVGLKNANVKGFKNLSEEMAGQLSVGAQLGGEVQGSFKEEFGDRSASVGWIAAIAGGILARPYARLIHKGTQGARIEGLEEVLHTGLEDVERLVHSYPGQNARAYLEALVGGAIAGGTLSAYSRSQRKLLARLSGEKKQLRGGDSKPAEQTASTEPEYDPKILAAAEKAKMFNEDVVDGMTLDEFNTVFGEDFGLGHTLAERKGLIIEFTKPAEDFTDPEIGERDEDPLKPEIEEQIAEDVSDIARAQAGLSQEDEPVPITRIRPDIVQNNDELGAAKAATDAISTLAENRAEMLEERAGVFVSVSGNKKIMEVINESLSLDKDPVTYQQELNDVSAIGLGALFFETESELDYDDTLYAQLNDRGIYPEGRIGKKQGYEPKDISLDKLREDIKYLKNTKKVMDKKFSGIENSNDESIVVSIDEEAGKGLNINKSRVIRDYVHLVENAIEQLALGKNELGEDIKENYYKEDHEKLHHSEYALTLDNALNKHYPELAKVGAELASALYGDKVDAKNYLGELSKYGTKIFAENLVEIDTDDDSDIAEAFEEDNYETHDDNDDLLSGSKTTDEAKDDLDVETEVVPDTKEADEFYKSGSQWEGDVRDETQVYASNGYIAELEVTQEEGYEFEGAHGWIYNENEWENRRQGEEAETVFDKDLPKKIKSREQAQKYMEDQVAKLPKYNIDDHPDNDPTEINWDDVVDTEWVQKGNDHIKQTKLKGVIFKINSEEGIHTAFINVKDRQVRETYYQEPKYSLDDSKRLTDADFLQLARSGALDHLGIYDIAAEGLIEPEVVEKKPASKPSKKAEKIAQVSEDDALDVDEDETEVADTSELEDVKVKKKSKHGFTFKKPKGDSGLNVEYNIFEGDRDTGFIFGHGKSAPDTVYYSFGESWETDPLQWDETGLVKTDNQLVEKFDTFLDENPGFLDQLKNSKPQVKKKKLVETLREEIAKSKAEDAAKESKPEETEEPGDEAFDDDAVEEILYNSTFKKEGLEDRITEDIENLDNWKKVKSKEKANLTFVNKVGHMSLMIVIEPAYKDRGWHFDFMTKGVIDLAGKTTRMYKEERTIHEHENASKKDKEKLDLTVQSWDALFYLKKNKLDPYTLEVAELESEDGSYEAAFGGKKEESKPETETEEMAEGWDYIGRSKEFGENQTMTMRKGYQALLIIRDDEYHGSVMTEEESQKGSMGKSVEEFENLQEIVSTRLEAQEYINNWIDSNPVENQPKPKESLLRETKIDIKSFKPNDLYQIEEYKTKDGYYLRAFRLWDVLNIDPKNPMTSPTEDSPPNELIGVIQDDSHNFREYDDDHLVLIRELPGRGKNLNKIKKDLIESYLTHEHLDKPTQKAETEVEEVGDKETDIEPEDFKYNSLYQIDEYKTADGYYLRAFKLWDVLNLDPNNPMSSPTKDDPPNELIGVIQDDSHNFRGYDDDHLILIRRQPGRGKNLNSIKKSLIESYLNGDHVYDADRAEEIANEVKGLKNVNEKLLQTVDREIHDKKLWKIDDKGIANELKEIHTLDLGSANIRVYLNKSFRHAADEYQQRRDIDIDVDDSPVVNHNDLDNIVSEKKKDIYKVDYKKVSELMQNFMIENDFNPYMMNDFENPEIDGKETSIDGVYELDNGWFNSHIVPSHNENLYKVKEKHLINLEFDKRDPKGYFAIRFFKLKKDVSVLEFFKDLGKKDFGKSKFLKKEGYPDYNDGVSNMFTRDAKVYTEEIFQKYIDGTLDEETDPEDDPKPDPKPKKKGKGKAKAKPDPEPEETKEETKEEEPLENAPETIDNWNDLEIDEGKQVEVTDQSVHKKSHSDLEEKVYNEIADALDLTENNFLKIFDDAVGYDENIEDFERYISASRLDRQSKGMSIDYYKTKHLFFRYKNFMIKFSGHSSKKILINEEGNARPYEYEFLALRHPPSGRKVDDGYGGTYVDRTAAISGTYDLVYERKRNEKDKITPIEFKKEIAGRISKYIANLDEDHIDKKAFDLFVDFDEKLKPEENNLDAFSTDEEFDEQFHADNIVDEWTSKEENFDWGEIDQPHALESGSKNRTYREEYKPREYEPEQEFQNRQKIYINDVKNYHIDIDDFSIRVAIGKAEKIKTTKSKIDSEGEHVVQEEEIDTGIKDQNRIYAKLIIHHRISDDVKNEVFEGYADETLANNIDERFYPKIKDSIVREIQEYLFSDRYEKVMDDYTENDLEAAKYQSEPKEDVKEEPKEEGKVDKIEGIKIISTPDDHYTFKPLKTGNYQSVNNMEVLEMIEKNPVDSYSTGDREFTIKKDGEHTGLRFRTMIVGKLENPKYKHISKVKVTLVRNEEDRFDVAVFPIQNYGRALTMLADKMFYDEHLGSAKRKNGTYYDSVKNIYVNSYNNSVHSKGYKYLSPEDAKSIFDRKFKHKYKSKYGLELAHRSVESNSKAREKVYNFDIEHKDKFTGTELRYSVANKFAHNVISVEDKIGPGKHNRIYQFESLFHDTGIEKDEVKDQDDLLRILDKHLDEKPHVLVNMGIGKKVKVKKKTQPPTFKQSDEIEGDVDVAPDDMPPAEIDETNENDSPSTDKDNKDSKLDNFLDGVEFKKRTNKFLLGVSYQLDNLKKVLFNEDRNQERLADLEKSNRRSELLKDPEKLKSVIKAKESNIEDTAQAQKAKEELNDLLANRYEADDLELYDENSYTSDNAEQEADYILNEIWADNFGSDVAKEIKLEGKVPQIHAKYTLLSNKVLSKIRTIKGGWTQGQSRNIDLEGILQTADWFDNKISLDLENKNLGDFQGMFPTMKSQVLSAWWMGSTRAVVVNGGGAIESAIQGAISRYAIGFRPVVKNQLLSLSALNSSSIGFYNGVSFLSEENAIPVTLYGNGLHANLLMYSGIDPSKTIPSDLQMIFDKINNAHFNRVSIIAPKGWDLDLMLNLSRSNLEVKAKLPYADNSLEDANLFLITNKIVGGARIAESYTPGLIKNQLGGMFGKSWVEFEMARKLLSHFYSIRKDKKGASFKKAFSDVKENKTSKWFKKYIEAYNKKDKGLSDKVIDLLLQNDLIEKAQGDSYKITQKGLLQYIEQSGRSFTSNLSEVYESFSDASFTYLSQDTLHKLLPAKLGHSREYIQTIMQHVQNYQIKTIGKLGQDWALMARVKTAIEKLNELGRTDEADRLRSVSTLSDAKQFASYVFPMHEVVREINRAENVSFALQGINDIASLIRMYVPDYLNVEDAKTYLGDDQGNIYFTDFMMGLSSGHFGAIKNENYPTIKKNGLSTPEKAAKYSRALLEWYKNNSGNFSDALNDQIHNTFTPSGIENEIGYRLNSYRTLNYLERARRIQNDYEFTTYLYNPPHVPTNDPADNYQNKKIKLKNNVYLLNLDNINWLSNDILDRARKSDVPIPREDLLNEIGIDELFEHDRMKIAVDKKTDYIYDRYLKYYQNAFFGFRNSIKRLMEDSIDELIEKIKTGKIKMSDNRDLALLEILARNFVSMVQQKTDTVKSLDQAKEAYKYDKEMSFVDFFQGEIQNEVFMERKVQEELTLQTDVSFSKAFFNDFPNNWPNWLFPHIQIRNNIFKSPREIPIAYNSKIEDLIFESEKFPLLIRVLEKQFGNDQDAIFDWLQNKLKELGIRMELNQPAMIKVLNDNGDAKKRNEILARITTTLLLIQKIFGFRVLGVLHTSGDPLGAMVKDRKKSSDKLTEILIRDGMSDAVASFSAKDNLITFARTTSAGSFGHEYFHLVFRFLPQHAGDAGWDTAQALAFYTLFKGDVDGLIAGLAQMFPILNADPDTINSFNMTQAQLDDLVLRVNALKELSQHGKNDFKTVDDKLAEKILGLIPLERTKYYSIQKSREEIQNEALEQGDELLTNNIKGWDIVEDMEEEARKKGAYDSTAGELVPKMFEYYVAKKLKDQGIDDRFVSNPAAVLGSDSESFVNTANGLKVAVFPNIEGFSDYAMNLIQNFKDNLSNDNGIMKLKNENVNPISMPMMKDDGDKLISFLDRVDKLLAKIETTSGLTINHNVSKGDWKQKISTGASITGDLVMTMPSQATIDAVKKAPLPKGATGHHIDLSNAKQHSDPQTYKMVTRMPEKLDYYVENYAQYILLNKMAAENLVATLPQVGVTAGSIYALIAEFIDLGGYDISALDFSKFKKDAKNADKVKSLHNKINKRLQVLMEQSYKDFAKDTDKDNNTNPHWRLPYNLKKKRGGGVILETTEPFSKKSKKWKMIPAHIEMAKYPNAKIRYSRSASVDIGPGFGKTIIGLMILEALRNLNIAVNKTFMWFTPTYKLVNQMLGNADLIHLATMPNVVKKVLASIDKKTIKTAAQLDKIIDEVADAYGVNGVDVIESLRWATYESFTHPSGTIDGNREQIIPLTELDGQSKWEAQNLKVIEGDNPDPEVIAYNEEVKKRTKVEEKKIKELLKLGSQYDRKRKDGEESRLFFAVVLGVEGAGETIYRRDLAIIKSKGKDTKRINTMLPRTMVLTNSRMTDAETVDGYITSMMEGDYDGAMIMDESHRLGNAFNLSQPISPDPYTESIEDYKNKYKTDGFLTLDGSNALKQMTYAINYLFPKAKTTFMSGTKAQKLSNLFQSPKALPFGDVNNANYSFDLIDFLGRGLRGKTTSSQLEISQNEASNLGYSFPISPKNSQGGITQTPLKMDTNTKKAMQELDDLTTDALLHYPEDLLEELLKPIRVQGDDGSFREFKKFKIKIVPEDAKSDREFVEMYIHLQHTARHLSSRMNTSFAGQYLKLVKFHLSNARIHKRIDAMEKVLAKGGKQMIQSDFNLTENIDKEYELNKGVIDIYSPTRHFFRNLLKTDVIPTINQEGELVNEVGESIKLELTREKFEELEKDKNKDGFDWTPYQMRGAKEVVYHDNTEVQEVVKKWMKKFEHLIKQPDMQKAQIAPIGGLLRKKFGKQYVSSVTTGLWEYVRPDPNSAKLVREKIEEPRQRALLLFQKSHMVGDRPLYEKSLPLKTLENGDKAMIVGDDGFIDFKKYPKAKALVEAEGVKVILYSGKSGGIGEDLHNTDGFIRVLEIADIPHNIIEFRQAIGRPDRTKQLAKAIINLLFFEDMLLEQKLLGSAMNKLSNLQAATGDRETSSTGNVSDVELDIEQNLKYSIAIETIFNELQNIMNDPKLKESNNLQDQTIVDLAYQLKTYSPLEKYFDDNPGAGIDEPNADLRPPIPDSDRNFFGAGEWGKDAEFTNVRRSLNRIGALGEVIQEIMRSLINRVANSNIDIEGDDSVTQAELLDTKPSHTISYGNSAHLSYFSVKKKRPALPYKNAVAKYGKPWAILINKNETDARIIYTHNALGTKLKTKENRQEVDGAIIYDKNFKRMDIAPVQSIGSEGQISKLLGVDTRGAYALSSLFNQYIPQMLFEETSKALDKKYHDPYELSVISSPNVPVHHNFGFNNKVMGSYFRSAFDFSLNKVKKHKEKDRSIIHETFRGTLEQLLQEYKIIDNNMAKPVFKKLKARNKTIISKVSDLVHSAEKINTFVDDYTATINNVTNNTIVYRNEVNQPDFHERMEKFVDEVEGLSRWLRNNQYRTGGQAHNFTKKKQFNIPNPRTDTEKSLNAIFEGLNSAMVDNIDAYNDLGSELSFTNLRNEDLNLTKYFYIKSNGFNSAYDPKKVIENVEFTNKEETPYLALHNDQAITIVQNFLKQAKIFKNNKNPTQADTDNYLKIQRKFVEGVGATLKNRVNTMPMASAKLIVDSYNKSNKVLDEENIDFIKGYYGSMILKLLYAWSTYPQNQASNSLKVLNNDEKNMVFHSIINEDRKPVRMTSEDMHDYSGAKNNQYNDTKESVDEKFATFVTNYRDEILDIYNDIDKVYDSMSQTLEKNITRSTLWKSINPDKSNNDLDVWDRVIGRPESYLENILVLHGENQIEVAKILSDIKQAEFIAGKYYKDIQKEATELGYKNKPEYAALKNEHESVKVAVNGTLQSGFKIKPFDMGMQQQGDILNLESKLVDVSGKPLRTHAGIRSHIELMPDMLDDMKKHLTKSKSFIALKDGNYIINIASFYGQANFRDLVRNKLLVPIDIKKIEVSNLAIIGTALNYKIAFDEYGFYFGGTRNMDAAKLYSLFRMDIWMARDWSQIRKYYDNIKGLDQALTIEELNTKLNQ